MNLTTAAILLLTGTVLLGGCSLVSQKQVMNQDNNLEIASPAAKTETIEELPVAEEVDQIETEIMNLEIFKEDFSDI